MQTHAVLCSLIINCASDEIIVNYQLRDCFVFFFFFGWFCLNFVCDWFSVWLLCFLKNFNHIAVTLNFCIIQIKLTWGVSN